jgi:phage terminase large subunit-like protein
MNWPCKKLEESVLGGKIAHGGNPVLRWMAGNVSIEKDAADNWKPSKKKSIERIDGIVALIMALDRASMGSKQRTTFRPIRSWCSSSGIVRLKKPGSPSNMGRLGRL